MPFINGIGPFELIIILAIALIVVGPGRLPDVGAALGKSIREFRKAATDVKDITSIEPAKPEPAAPAPMAAAPVVPAVSSAIPAAAPVVDAPADVAAPPPAEVPPPAEMAAALAAEPVQPEIGDRPDPAPGADEQPTRTG